MNERHAPSSPADAPSAAPICGHLRATLLAAVVIFFGLSGIVVAADPARRALDRVQPEMKFTNIALGDCLDFIRDVSGVNLHVNWRALEAIGVTRDTPVNVRLRSVTLRKTLSLLLSEAGAGSQITFYVDEGVIEITTRELADKQMLTRIYLVEDLLMDVPDFTAPAVNLSSTPPSSGSGGGGGGSGASLFNGTNTNSSEQKGQSKAEKADALVKLITEVVQPEIWRDNGGPAAIRYYNGLLIITAPRSVHEAIGGPLD